MLLQLKSMTIFNDKICTVLIVETTLRVHYQKKYYPLRRHECFLIDKVLHNLNLGINCLNLQATVTMHITISSDIIVIS